MRRYDPPKRRRRPSPVDLLRDRPPTGHAESRGQGTPYGYYLEPEGTVLAIHRSFYRTRSGGRIYEGYGALYPYANSRVVWTSVSDEYLRHCRRISEQEARRRHPALFERIEVEAA